jgi:hypothetical protein
MSPLRFCAASASLVLLAGRLIAADLAPAVAPDTPPPAAAAPAAEQKSSETTQLEDRMEEMNTAFKRLRRQISDPSQNASSLTQVKKLRRSAELAAKLEPAMVKELPPADRPKFLANYEAEMEKLLKSLADLEAAIQKNDNAAASEIVAKIGAHQKQAHNEFRKP